MASEAGANTHNNGTANTLFGINVHVMIEFCLSCLFCFVLFHFISCYSAKTIHEKDTQKPLDFIDKQNSFNCRRSILDDVNISCGFFFFFFVLHSYIVVI